MGTIARTKEVVMKCSACGADVPAMNIQYSWKQLLFIVPLLLLGFWPLAQLTILRGDATKDLVIRQVVKKLSFQNSPNGTLVAVSYTHLRAHET